MMPFRTGHNAAMQRNAAIVIGLVVVVAAALIGFLLVSAPGTAQPPSSSPSPSEPASPEPSTSASASLNAELLDRRWTVLYVGTDLNA